MIEKFTIVDGHVHTFPTDEIALKIIESFNRVYDIEFENPGTGSINDVLKNMVDIGIDYTIMANFAPPKILHANNLWAIDVAEKHNNLIPLVSFHPDMEGSMPAFLEQYMKKGARGIKIHPMSQAFEPNHPKMQDLYRFCNETAFPIVFHCGRVSNARLNEYADVEQLLPVINTYPDIPIILTHMADGNIKDVERLRYNYSNVYFDTSIVITGYPHLKRVNKPSWLEDGFVVDVIKRIGAERMLFGSDYPWGSPKHDLERFMGMKLTDEEKILILGKNSIELFNINS